MDTEEVTDKWLALNSKICICKGIPRKRFIAAIESGAGSVAEVHRLVGSGNGDCKGERCGPRIEALLNEFTDPGKK